MRLSALLLSVVLSAAVPASSWLSQIPLSDEFAVPGENPLFFCADPADNILEIKTVNLSPNPPEAGSTLTINATGTLKEPVEDGAKIHLQVKWGLVTIVNQQADLCTTIENVDLSCPLDEGDMEMTKDVALPKQIPPGKYTVLADVFTKSQEKITCLNAEVVFDRTTGFGANFGSRKRNLANERNQRDEALHISHASQDEL